MALRQAIYVIAAKRTPFGAYGGKLKDHSAIDLAEISSKAALEAANIQPELINSVIIGNVIQTSKDVAYIARHVSLRCGIPIPVPALAVNRLCGSGFQAVVNGVQDICMGDSEVALCSGTESMSQAPFVARNMRFGTMFGYDYVLEDVLWAGLTDQHIKMPMGVTAENLATKYSISREQCDAYALKSQTRWKEANTSGYFKEEIVPISIKTKKATIVVDVDEHPRETTPASLAKLLPVFKKDGTVTAGNASGVCDGAGTVIIASEEAVKKNNWKPLAKILGYHAAGCDPTIMGIGPAYAIRSLYDKTKIPLEKIDLIEVNEAFAPQYLAVEKELGLNEAISNVNGGAIALGHPLGASGARITAHLVHELRRRGGHYAIGSACIGGGQGIAILLENVK